MKVHEYQAKEIFSRYEIPVERHVLCNTPDEAVKAFRQFTGQLSGYQRQFKPCKGY